MGWKFLNISKANSRIDELESQLAAITKERDDAKAAATAAPPAQTTATGTTVAPPADDDMDECETCNGTGTCAECMGNGKCAECSGDGEVKKGAAAVGTVATMRAKIIELQGFEATLQSVISAKNADISALNGEVKSLTEKLAAKDGDVKVQVSRQVAETQAKLGQPALPAIPKDAKNASSNGKSGMARVLESSKADLEAAGYVRKN